MNNPEELIDYWYSGQPTLRDQFAMAALSALVSRDTINEDGTNNSASWAVMNPLENYKTQAVRSYEYADAMMKARDGK